MSRLLLTIARLALSAWVGAAAMFVTIGVREVTLPAFDSVTRDQLALLRFPPYYVFGFALVGTAGAAIAAVLPLQLLSKRRSLTALACVAAALLLMTYDYVAIYRPLTEMVSPPGQPKPSAFRALHQQSESINTLDVGLCLAAAVTLCWPRSGSATACDPKNAPSE